MTQTQPSVQANGAYHLKLGEMVITAVNDGFLTAAFGYMTGIEAAAAERLHVGAHRVLPPLLTINAFLINDGRTLTLVDGGAGGAIGPSAGHLLANLAAIGVAPAAIGRILVTHMHVDHVNGLVDAAGAALFPNAEMLAHQAEADFWLGEPPAGAPEPLRDAFARAQRGVLPYRDRLRTLRDGEAAAPGITAVHAPGHTPGHCGFRLDSAGEALLIWGDVVHMPGVQFAEPGAGMAFDVDGAEAIATRRRLFDMAANERLRVAGMHHDFPAFGHVDRHGSGFAFVPEVWSPTV